MSRTGKQHFGRVILLLLGFVFCSLILDGGRQSMCLAAAPSTSSATTEPAAQPWAAKPSDQWPPLLLKNHITLKGFAPWQGVAAFLMKLPTGQVVGVTTRDELVQGVNLGDLKGSVAQWTLSPPTRASQTVVMRALAMPADSCQSMNCVMMTTSSSYPVEVLIPSPTRAQVGQTVFLVGTSVDGSKPTQVVYEGTVVQLDHPTPGLIAFDYHAHVPPNSFSGSPVLDTQGHVIGIHQSYYPEHTSAETIVGQAFQITTVIAAVNLPPDPKAMAAARVSAAADSAANSTAKSATTHPTAAPADPAQAELRTARAYLASKSYEIASSKLHDIIQKYPNTPTAKEAQADLDSIPKSDANQ